MEWCVVAAQLLAEPAGEQEVAAEIAVADEVAGDHLRFLAQPLDHGEQHPPHGRIVRGHGGDLHAASPFRLLAGRLLQRLDLEVDQAVSHGEGEETTTVEPVDHRLEQGQEPGGIEPTGNVQRSGFFLARHPRPGRLSKDLLHPLPSCPILHHRSPFLPIHLLQPFGRHGLLEFLLPGQLVRLLQRLAQ